MISYLEKYEKIFGSLGNYLLCISYYRTYSNFNIFSLLKLKIKHRHIYTYYCIINFIYIYIHSFADKGKSGQGTMNDLKSKLVYNTTTKKSKNTDVLKLAAEVCESTFTLDMLKLI